MKISGIVNAINRLARSDDFEAYIRTLQSGSPAGAPTEDEARIDYQAMMKSRLLPR